MRHCNCSMSHGNMMVHMALALATSATGVAAASSSSSSSLSSDPSSSAHMEDSSNTGGHNHGDSFGYGFYSWFEELSHSKRSLPPIVLAVLVLAFVAEGLGSLLGRLRARPLFWVSSRCVTMTLHNILATLVHALKMTLMFTLMVIFMSLNPWMCSAIVLGSAVGHLAFNWKLSWESEGPDKEADDLRPHW